MNTKQNLLAALALTLSLASPKAISITTNTALSPGDTTYEGADLIVSDCALTVNGAHCFASPRQPWFRFVIIEPDVGP